MITARFLESFRNCSLACQVPSKLQQSFSFWNKGRSKPELVCSRHTDGFSNVKTVESVSFRPVIGLKGRLKAVGITHGRVSVRSCSGGNQTRSCSLASADSHNNLKGPRVSGDLWLHGAPERDLDSILSMHSSMYNFETT